MKRTLFATLFAAVCATTLVADNGFLYNGIRYNSFSDGECSVINRATGDPAYSGDIVLPEYAEDNGVRYKVTSISGRAFMWCEDLTSIDLGKVLTIGSSAFTYCNKLTSLDLTHVQYISDAFYKCDNLEYVDFGKNVNISSYAFEDCAKLSCLNMLRADALASVPGSFRNCNNLETVYLPYEWSSNFNPAFVAMPSLWSIYIGEKTAAIPDNAFADNTKLLEVYSNAATPPAIGAATFSKETFTYATVYVPHGCIDAYRKADGWKAFDDFKELPFSVKASESKITIKVDDTACLTAAIDPADATTSSVKWYSLNEDVATVTPDGIVTGVAVGGVSIIAQCDGITATVKVVVKKKSGIEDIAVDSATDDSEPSTFDLYNLQGTLLRRNCTDTDIVDLASSLPHGIYILVSGNISRKIRL